MFEPTGIPSVSAVASSRFSRAWTDEICNSTAMIYLRYNFRKGFMGYTPKAVKSLGKSGDNTVIYDGGVYDMSTYITNNG